MPYVIRLFELVTGEAWNVNPYVADDRSKVPLIVAMQGAFEEGRAYFEKTGKPFPGTPAETAQSFAWFNQSLNKDTFQPARQRDTMQKIAVERSRSGGHLVRMGSYMAQKLFEKYSAGRLTSYSNSGSIGFFSDYLQLTDVPSEFRINSDAAGALAV